MMRYVSVIARVYECDKISYYLRCITTSVHMINHGHYVR